jgi:hypothetical protein
MRSRVYLSVVLLLVSLCTISAQAQGPQVQGTLGTGFTYQGQLRQGGSPVSGTCDFQFSLWNAATSGTQLGTTQTKASVAVTRGMFTVLLDFGGVFKGDARWLGIKVRCPAGSGTYTTLIPRQSLTPAPYALALRGLWTEPNSSSPNVIGGYSENSTAVGVVGAVISGGGTTLNTNRVGDSYGTVGGGLGNLAGDGAGTTSDASYATVGGGNANTARGAGATVAGGSQNTASGGYSAVAGGEFNAASGYDAVVGGGYQNTASGEKSTVGGGYENTASGERASVGGGDYNEASNYESTVSGGGSNTASGLTATVGGGGLNEASGLYATVPGGWNNEASGMASFAAGNGAKAGHDGAFVWADALGNEIFQSTAANQFAVRAGAGVKIVKGANTFSPTAAALQVDNAATTAEGAWLRLHNASNPYPVLKLAKASTTSNFVEGVFMTTTETRKFYIDANGAYHAGADFAESMPAAGGNEGYEPGDVLVISADQAGAVEKSSNPYDTAVIGVYSTEPGFVGGVAQGLDDVPVAVVGIVPVKASAENGAIAPGDLLATSATPGHVMRCIGAEQCFGRTIGKALEGLDNGTGVIRMLVSLQ